MSANTHFYHHFQDKERVSNRKEEKKKLLPPLTSYITYCNWTFLYSVDRIYFRLLLPSIVACIDHFYLPYRTSQHKYKAFSNWLNNFSKESAALNWHEFKYKRPMNQHLKLRAMKDRARKTENEPKECGDAGWWKSGWSKIKHKMLFQLIYVFLVFIQHNFRLIFGIFLLFHSSFSTFFFVPFLYKYTSVQWEGLL